MDIEKKKLQIEDIGLDVLKEFLKSNKNIKPEEFDRLHKKARIGMQFEREVNVHKRCVENNTIKIFRMISTNKDELKEYIKKSLPKYLDKL